MRVVVLGASGMLGRYMSTYFSKYNCVSLMRGDVNALDSTDVIRYRVSSKLKKDDVVINCIGVLKPNICKIGKVNTILINAVFPEIISRVCEDIGAKMIHISSDCIFDGLRGSYTESDTSYANDIYAQTKSIEPQKALTIRTSFIGESNRSDNVGLLGWLIANRNNSIKGYANCLWNGVTCLQLVKAIDQLIIKDKITHQTKHIHSPRVISKYELCGMINDIYNLNLKIDKHDATIIEGTTISGVLDRSLQSTSNPVITLPDIETQIDEQKKYKL